LLLKKISKLRCIYTFVIAVGFVTQIR